MEVLVTATREDLDRATGEWSEPYRTVIVRHRGTIVEVTSDDLHDYKVRTPEGDILVPASCLRTVDLIERIGELDVAHWTDKASDKDLVEALCEIDSGLSDWEVERADEWHKQVSGGRPLTDKQRAKAVEILKERA